MAAYSNALLERGIPMYRDHELGVVFHHGVLARSAVPLRLAQVVRVPFALVYVVLATRFVLEYVGARPSVFAQWVARLTNPLFIPLRGLFATGHDPAGHPVAWSLLVAIGACAVVQWVLVSWLRDVARPGVTEE
jgi:uncharacterized protein YggT (Ycf19 family)